MYSEVFCRVYNVFGWNYYPEAFGEQLIDWLKKKDIHPQSCLDMGCGTGVLCRLLHSHGIKAAGMDLSEGMIAIAREESPEIPFEVGNMVTYVPSQRFDLVTCTGDALNHIGEIPDVQQILRNVYSWLNPGGWFVFDILNENEVSSGEPFEMDFSDSIWVWFQMTCPEPKKVNLKIRVYENGILSFEENIRETVHDPAVICDMLVSAGFTDVRCANRLLPEHNPSTTWFVTARKE